MPVCMFHAFRRTAVSSVCRRTCGGFHGARRPTSNDYNMGRRTSPGKKCSETWNRRFLWNGLRVLWSGGDTFDLVLHAKAVGAIFSDRFLRETHKFVFHSFLSFFREIGY